MRALRPVAIPAAIAFVFLGSAAARGLPHYLGRPPLSASSANAGAFQPLTGPTGDFNGDGFADLAVGVPYEDIGSLADPGAVNVLYGSDSGLVAAGNQYWTQDSTGIGDFAERGDQFGFAVTAGDFNGDGFSDLAVGVPAEDAPEDSGAVSVIYGSAAGLVATGNQLWTQNSQGIPDGREPGERFGSALAAADFNHDGASDLAIGVPYERVDGRAHAGAVNVIYGSPSGLTGTGARFFSQNSFGIKDASERGDLFGFALAASDFDNDTFGDLAIGVPGEDPRMDSGAVNVLYGRAGGLGSARNQLWTQDSTGIGDKREQSDLFGYSLAAGDLTGDGFADLVVGVPFENIWKKANAGAVNVIYGSANGLHSARNQFWSQDTPGIRSIAEGGDELGFAVAIEDFNGDGPADLAIGLPGEDPPMTAGSVAVIVGTPSGLSAAGNQLWSQEGLGGSPNEVGDAFGMSLAAGRFGKGDPADLAIGAPSEDVVTKVDAGAISVAYGSADGLQPEGSQFWTQDDIAGPAEAGDRFSYGVGAHPP